MCIHEVFQMTPEQEERIRIVADLVRAHEPAETGHDWLHIERVWRLATRFASEEQTADQYLVSLAALTHDLDDHKFTAAGDEPFRLLRSFLDAAHVSVATTRDVEAIVSQVSWSNGITQPTTVEARIVQDADRLDAIGAIGIARAFSYGGFKARPFYERVERESTIAPFADAGESTVAHFAEKLLLITGRLHTESARTLARRRHEYLLGYLAQLADEIDGKR
jgi:uncharacterized protein